MLNHEQGVHRAGILSIFCTRVQDWESICHTLSVDAAPNPIVDTNSGASFRKFAKAGFFALLMNWRIDDSNQGLIEKAKPTQLSLEGQLNKEGEAALRCIYVVSQISHLLTAVAYPATA